MYLHTLFEIICKDWKIDKLNIIEQFKHRFTKTKLTKKDYIHVI